MRVNWREVFKFLSGAAFIGAVTNFYLYINRVELPQFLGFRLTPEFLGLRSLVTFILFLAFFYFGYLKKR